MKLKAFIKAENPKNRAKQFPRVLLWKEFNFIEDKLSLKLSLFPEMFLGYFPTKKKASKIKGKKLCGKEFI